MAPIFDTFFFCRRGVATVDVRFFLVATLPEVVPDQPTQAITAPWISNIPTFIITLLVSY